MALASGKDNVLDLPDLPDPSDLPDLSFKLFQCPGRPGIAQQGGEDVCQDHTAPDPIYFSYTGNPKGSFIPYITGKNRATY